MELNLHSLEPYIYTVKYGKTFILLENQAKLYKWMLVEDHFHKSGHILSLYWAKCKTTTISPLISIKVDHCTKRGMH